MTTRLEKPVRRVVPARGWGDLVVELTNAGVVLREKGHRIRYGPLSYGALMMLGARQLLEEKRKLKAAKRKARSCKL